MAEKGNSLWLKLGIDISEFEAAFSQADKVSRKQQTAINANLRKISDAYAIQANNAKLAGDSDKARAIAVEALTAKVKLLAAAEANYAKMAEKARAGGNKHEITAATNAYNRAILQRQRAQLELQGSTANGGIWGNFARGLANRAGLGGIVAEFDSGAAAAKSFGVSTGALAAGIGALAVGVYAGTKAFGAYTDSIKAAQDTELSLYNIMRKTGLSAREADSLADTFAIGGVDAETGISVLQRLNKQILSAGANGNETTKALAKWNVTLTDGSGKLKPYIEQLQALSDGYSRAKESGQELEYLTETLGTRGAGLSKLLADFQLLTGELDKLGSHRSVDSAVVEAATNDILGKLLDNSISHTTQLAGRYSLDVLGEFKNALLDVSQAFRQFLETPEGEEAFRDLADAIKTVIRDIRDLLVALPQLIGKFNEFRKSVKDSALGRVMSMLPGPTWALSPLTSLIKGQGNGVDTGRIERVRKGVTNGLQRSKMSGMGTSTTSDAEARIKANREVSEALFKLTASETEQKLSELNKQVEAWRKAGADETTIARYEALRREEIEAEAERKIREEKEKTLKSAQAAAEKQARTVAKAVKAEQDAQKQRMSAAEQALTSQIKLWRAYLKMGDTAEFQDYALKQTLKSKGIRQSDYAAMNDRDLTGYMHAMQRFNDNTWLSNVRMPSFNGSPVGVNVTVNFDNTVVDDMGTIDRLANKVADTITPVITRAIGGEAYGY